MQTPCHVVAGAPGGRAAKLPWHIPARAGWHVLGRKGLAEKVLSVGSRAAFTSVTRVDRVDPCAGSSTLRVHAEWQACMLLFPFLHCAAGGAATCTSGCGPEALGARMEGCLHPDGASLSVAAGAGLVVLRGSLCTSSWYSDKTGRLHLATNTAAPFNKARPLPLHSGLQFSVTTRYGMGRDTCHNICDASLGRQNTDEGRGGGTGKRREQAVLSGRKRRSRTDGTKQNRRQGSRSKDKGELQVCGATLRLALHLFCKESCRCMVQPCGEHSTCG